MGPFMPEILYLEPTGEIQEAPPPRMEGVECLIVYP